MISSFSFTRHVAAATWHCRGSPESRRARQAALIDAANSFIYIFEGFLIIRKLM